MISFLAREKTQTGFFLKATACFSIQNGVYSESFYLK